jgi:hypothetical protein
MEPTRTKQKEPNMEQTVVDRPAPPADAPSRYEPCETCGAPLDRQQRYCVNCASPRPGASSPAATYFGAVSRRSRQLRAAPAPRGSSARAAAVVFFALLPAAVGLGVVVGHSGNSGSNADTAGLVAALKASGTGTSTSDTALASDTGGGSITSDFSLPSGYAVQLDTLPVKGTDADAVKSAESSATSKGAKDVGIINPADFTIKPDPGSSSYVLYSGEFKSQGDAQKALGKLKKDFKDAKVIHVTAASGGAAGASGAVNKSGASDSSGGAGGKVIAHTSHGDIHSVQNIAPTQADQDIGARIAAQQAQQTGHNYVQNQANLPDVIAVGGDGSSPPPPTSPGD